MALCVCVCVCVCMHASNFFIRDRGCTNWCIILEEWKNLLCSAWVTLLYFLCITTSGWRVSPSPFHIQSVAAHILSCFQFGLINRANQDNNVKCLKFGAWIFYSLAR